MVVSKSPRQAALAGLKKLSSDRVDKEGHIGSIYHWGIIAPKQGRERYLDRPTAITAATVLEHGLEEAILCLLHRSGADIRDKLFEGNGAVLRDFSAKITMAHAMGILGDQSRSDISMIRHIRNTFAHSRLSIDFRTPGIIAACEQISLPRRIDMGCADDVREGYIQSCFEFSLWLFTYEHHLHGKLAPDEHPNSPRLQLAL